MRKDMKKLIAGLMVVGIVTTGSIAYASEAVGSTAAIADTEYSLGEMLTYAIEDEYLAQTEYNVIMEEYGIQKPFSNIIKAEARHISLLLPLLEQYDVAVPEKDWDSLLEVPDSLEASYKIAVTAEEKNIAMYASFLKKELPDDVKAVFENLMNASENHLRAFQNASDENCTGECQGNGNSENSNRGRGQGNGRGRNNTIAACILK